MQQATYLQNVSNLLQSMQSSVRSDRRLHPSKALHPVPQVTALARFSAFDTLSILRPGIVELSIVDCTWRRQETVTCLYLA